MPTSMFIYSRILSHY